MRNSDDAPHTRQFSPSELNKARRNATLEDKEQSRVQAQLIINDFEAERDSANQHFLNASPEERQKIINTLGDRAAALQKQMQQENTPEQYFDARETLLQVQQQLQYARNRMLIENGKPFGFQFAFTIMKISELGLSESEQALFNQFFEIKPGTLRYKSYPPSKAALAVFKKAQKAHLASKGDTQYDLDDAAPDNPLCPYSPQGFGAKANRAVDGPSFANNGKTRYVLARGQVFMGGGGQVPIDADTRTHGKSLGAVKHAGEEYLEELRGNLSEDPSAQAEINKLEPATFENAITTAIASLTKAAASKLPEGFQETANTVLAQEGSLSEKLSTLVEKSKGYGTLQATLQTHVYEATEAFQKITASVAENAIFLEVTQPDDTRSGASRQTSSFLIGDPPFNKAAEAAKCFSLPEQTADDIAGADSVQASIDELIATHGKDLRFNHVIGDFGARILAKNEKVWECESKRGHMVEACEVLTTWAKEIAKEAVCEEAIKAHAGVENRRLSDRADALKSNADAQSPTAQPQQEKDSTQHEQQGKSFTRNFAKRWKTKQTQKPSPQNAQESNEKEKSSALKTAAPFKKEALFNLLIEKKGRVRFKPDAQEKKSGGFLKPTGYQLVLVELAKVAQGDYPNGNTAALEDPRKPANIQTIEGKINEMSADTLSVLIDRTLLLYLAHDSQTQTPLNDTQRSALMEELKEANHRPFQHKRKTQVANLVEQLKSRRAELQQKSDAQQTSRSGINLKRSVSEESYNEDTPSIGHSDI